MSSSLQDSIVRITSSNPRESNFGTGFVFYRDDQGTYILTCAHVVNAVGGSEAVKARSLTASVIVPGSEVDVDLAVLRVEGLQDKPLLHLNASGKTGKNFTTVGFQKYSKQYIAVQLLGTLGDQVGVEASGYSELVEAWYLKITGDEQLQLGYSGSPIVDKESGQIIAVVSHRQDEGKKGLALSIKALTKIWHEMPITLLKELEPTSSFTSEGSYSSNKISAQDAYSNLLTAEERGKLITLLCRLPDIEYANVRHSLVSTLPAKFQSNIAYDKPPKVHIAEIVDSMISDAQFQFPDGSYPVMVLIQNAVHRVKRSQLGGQLQSLLDALKERLGVVPQIDTITTSLDRFIHYLDNFILQMPALEYELRSISNFFDDYMLQPDCETLGAHLTEVCTPFLDFATLLNQSIDLEVKRRRIWLMNALLDFNRQARVVERDIDRFCEMYGVVLEDDQPVGERQKIQKQLVDLTKFCRSVFETAERLYNGLG